MIDHASTPPRFVYRQVIVVLLVGFSIVMSAIISRTVFERLPHLEDEVAYFFQAKVFARGDLVIGTPQPYRAYWQPFVVDYASTGHRFGKYTPGWPGLLAVGVNLGQPWVVNAFLAGLTVALVYRLGREIFTPDVGVIAAALTAFSPMALLLNASLMGHTAALCFTTLFMVAYWRMARQGSHALRWGLLAGFALGMVVITRPLTAVGIATPFIGWNAVRLAVPFVRSIRKRDLEPRRYQVFFDTLRPLLALGIVTLIIASAIPIFNAAATGNPAQNLYTLVWDYDQIGFGECCGQHGHTLEKGVRQMRWDFALTAADMFGWQIGAITDAVRDHWLNGADYFPNVGLSWILLPFGLILGLRRRWSWAWLAVGAFWLLLLGPVINAGADIHTTLVPLWVIFGIVWMLAALGIVTAFNHHPSATWTWLLLAVPLCLIGVHLAYWIGSQRYSTRYYYEGLAAAALLSALPIAWLMRRVGRWPVYVLLALILLFVFATYTTPRITVLYRFNRVSQEIIEAVQDRRQGDRPVLVIVTGPGSGDDRALWRSRGSLMAVTSPYLDSDIVVAWDYTPGEDGVRDAILTRFPDRQVIEMTARGNDVWFVEETP